MKLLHGCFKHGRIPSKITENVHNCFISASTRLLVLKHWQNGSFITNFFNVHKVRLNDHIHFHYLLSETSCFPSSYRYEWYYRSVFIVYSCNRYIEWLIRGCLWLRLWSCYDKNNHNKFKNNLSKYSCVVI